MALQCRVVLNENNEIDHVKTEDGQRSQLFDGLVETLGGDKNSALGFYALTESEDFKTAQKAKKTESPAYSIAKVYKDRLTKEKQNNPSQYWSVDIPSDEVIEDAARNGRIVDVNGGMGIVTEDGNMIGMFKYDKNAKNTAQAVQEARIQKGGVKLDNYDGYLTKLYQKNGFRVAARLPFNKEFAPEDWSEEMHGTPDVVFMVYAPQNKLKIEEKIFEDYDEASNYRDSFITTTLSILEETGLADNVFQLSTQEIENKLIELGVEASVAKQVVAYHGSPHFFDRFTTEKMGTGEGAQAFGWGLYFTDLESIARNYAKVLSSKNSYFVDDVVGFKSELKDILNKYEFSKNFNLPSIDSNGVIDQITLDIFLEQFQQIEQTFSLDKKKLQDKDKNSKGILPQYLSEFNKMYDSIEKRVQEYNNFIKEIKEFEEDFDYTILGNKNLYKVVLHKGKTPSEYTWLEWDKSLSKNLANRLLEKAKNDENLAKSSIIFKLENPENYVGNDIYGGLNLIFRSGKEVSMFLLDAGIDGIKYPAESISRGATSDTARGFNYVVFDENAITIEEQIRFQKSGITPITNGFIHNNDVYLNKDTATEETEIHEFNHLYNNWLKQNRPEVYKKGLDLVKEEIKKGKQKEKLSKKDTKELKKLLDFKTDSVTIYDENATAEILIEQLSDGEVSLYISEIWSDIKGQGSATKLLNKIQSFSDEYNVAISLRASTNNNIRTSGGLEQEALVKWYEKNSFYISEEDNNFEKDETAPFIVYQPTIAVKSEIQDIIDFVKTNQPNLEGEKLNEEILTEMVGRRGLELLIEQKDKAKSSGIIDYLKQVWQEIKNMLGLSSYTDEQILNMNLQDFANASAIDLLRGERIDSERNGKQNTEFFEGKAKEASSKIPYTPVLKVDQTTPVAKAYSLYTAGGNFTGHISKMIAGFQEKQKQVAEAIVKGGFKNFLDLGTSEGGMIKTVASQDRSIKAVGIDPNREMQKNFNSTPEVKNAEFRLEAFQGSWTEDDGTKIKEFKTNQKFDVVNEDFMFQFVNNNREKQVKGVKELMTPEGIFITSEKFHTANEASNELKKYDHQRKYFSPDQLTEDKQTIVSGMADDMVNDVEYFNILKKNFKFVEEFWNAGNFKGYLASDSLEVLKEFKNNVGDLTSEFTDETSLTKPRPLVEPSVEEVVQYANATEEELTPEQTIDLQDVIMSLGVNNSKEAEKKLKEALETKGFIRFNKKQMLNSGAFNKYEVKQILNSKEKQDQVEQSYRALKNSPTIEVEYPKDGINRESKINSFCKQSVINPLLPTETEGVETKTVTKEGVLEDKTTGTDTEVILNNTYIGEENVKLSENLFFITKTFSPAVWENKKDAIFKVVKQIKEYAKDNGIDLKNIEEKVYTKSREEIINFFESLEDFLQKGDATEFAPLYNEMFELNKPVKESIRTDNKFDVYMDEDVSEYEAFTKHNLVKKSPTVYRKIKGDLSLDEAYSIVSQNEDISEEQLRKEIKENPLEVSDYEVDVEELEKMQLYKRYFNFRRNIATIKPSTQKKSFIRKANKWLLKSGNPYYKITKNGLELVSQDEITRSRAELTLPEYLKQEEKEEVIVEDLNKERRLESLVNPSSVQKVKGEFLYLEPEVVAIKNEVESMVRTPRGVFEYMYGQGNVGFYGKVVSEERPLSDMNYKQYTYLENSPELFQKAKNYYSKAELDEINKDNFECS